MPAVIADNGGMTFPSIVLVDVPDGAADVVVTVPDAETTCELDVPDVLCEAELVTVAEPLVGAAAAAA